MAQVHRQGDLRSCGHSTRVINQDFLKIDGQLAAVEGDSIIGGSGGDLQSSGINTFVKINGKLIIVVGDSAAPDSDCSPFNPPHCTPRPTQGSDLLTIG